MKTIILLALLFPAWVFAAPVDAIFTGDFSYVGIANGFDLEMQAPSAAFTKIMSLSGTARQFQVSLSGEPGASYCFRMDATALVYGNTLCGIVPQPPPPPAVTPKATITWEPVTPALKVTRCKTDTCAESIQVRKSREVTVNGVKQP